MFCLLSTIQVNAVVVSRSAVCESIPTNHFDNQLLILHENPLLLSLANIHN
jgi:hypothetical protein